MTTTLMRSGSSDVTIEQLLGGNGMTYLTVLVTALSVCVFGICVLITRERHRRTRRR